MRAILGALAFLAAAAPSSAFAPSSSPARRSPWTARASTRHGKEATVMMMAEKGGGEVEQEVTDLNLEEMFEVSRAVGGLATRPQHACIDRNLRRWHGVKPSGSPPG